MMIFLLNEKNGMMADNSSSPDIEKVMTKGLKLDDINLAIMVCLVIIWVNKLII